jgi:hypothetical protein
VLTRLQPSIRKADQERIGCNDARFESVFANARCHHASPADYETGTIGYQVREVSHRCDVDPGGAVDLKPADYLSFRDYGRPTRNVRGRWPQAFPVAHREAGPPNHPIVVSCFGPSRPLEKIMPAPGNLSTMNVPIRESWTQGEFFTWAGFPGRPLRVRRLPGRLLRPAAHPVTT